MSAPSHAPAPTSLREGRYALLRPLGAGAQGSTWDAVDRREGRPVAIKRFDVRGAREWKDVELAEREARVLAALSHPKLPRYLDHFEEDGVLYLVMEKIEGVPLSELSKQGPMSGGDVLRLLRDADDVLTYLHGRAPPVVHRDLKPSNVIRRPDGSFAFVDFGSVRDRLRPEGGSTVVGTFGYMAPEQFQGRAGPGSDVYAMGATALTLLTGEQPENLPHRGLAVDVDAALGEHADPRLRAALWQMLEIDPDRRPTRIGPLLERGRAAASRGGGRETRRAQRRAHRREQREAWRRGRRGRRGWAPPVFVLVLVALQLGLFLAFRFNTVLIVGLVFSELAVWSLLRGLVRWILALGLAIAQLVVDLVLQVVVPVLLLVLSVVAGRALREAAARVRRAGGRATDAMADARRRLEQGGAAVADEPRVRVATGEASPAEPPAEDEEDERDGPGSYGSRGRPAR